MYTRISYSQSVTYCLYNPFQTVCALLIHMHDFVESMIIMDVSKQMYTSLSSEVRKCKRGTCGWRSESIEGGREGREREREREGD